MGRRKNELFWDCFPKTGDGGLQCKFCNLKLAGSTSVSRLKFHLALIADNGVDICTKVPSEVQEAANQAITHHEDKKSKRRRMETASSSRGQNTVAENQARDVEMEGVAAQRMGPAAEKGRNPSFVRTETPSHNMNDVLMPPCTFTDGYLGSDTQLTTGQLMQSVPGNAAFIGNRNPSQNMNGVLMQPPVVASTFTGGHLENAMGQLMQQVHVNGSVHVQGSTVATRSAGMTQPAGIPLPLDEYVVMGTENRNGGFGFPPNDWQNFVNEPPEMQPPIETVPWLEEGESSMANMNNQLVNQVQGVLQPAGTPFPLDEDPVMGIENMTGHLGFPLNNLQNFFNEPPEMQLPIGTVPRLEEGESSMVNMNSQLVNQVQGVQREMQVSQLFENGGIAAGNIGREVAGGRTAGDRGDVMENTTEVLVPSVGGGRSADDRGRDSENMIQGQMIQPVGGVACAEGPDSSAHQTKGDILLTKKLFGKAFEINKRRIWECLMKDEILCIGICGMGGAGKTTLVTHINNELLKMTNPFRNVYWVTVSQNCSIHKLQARISRTIGIDLSDEDDERKRAAKLFKELESRHRPVLILDDLWDPFSLEKVGIPVGVNGCKLILTTRSLEICRRMDCQEKNIIKVEPLGEEEAWELFLETLGHGVSLPPEIREVAKGITKECGGLPLAIITMAGTMKGADHKREWERALETLKESEAEEGDMAKDVFRVLKFSYDGLSPTLQQCLLYCALFPEDFHIPCTDLIGHLIAEGIIERKRSVRADFSEGIFILNKLKRACLLEDCRTGTDGVKMHDLVRDMAVQILRADSKAMVEAGNQLEELPDEENWKEDLVTVSLMGNYFKEIPSAHSPNCPDLSTLLLCYNWRLKLISSSFFEKLNGLKILDLSRARIVELPDSVSELVNLTSLLLKNCWRLKRVPSLAKLKALKKLDLSGTDIEEMPHGMEFLSNLMYLDLHSPRKTIQFPIGILPQLSKLQFLDLGGGIAEASEVASLKKLEFVRFRFSDWHNWNNCIPSLEGSCMYAFILGEVYYFDDTPDLNELRENEVIIGSLDAINQVGSLALPKDVHRLKIIKCHELKSLYPAFAFSLHPATQLKELSVDFCDGMEWLLSEEEVVAQLQPPFLSFGNDCNINGVVFSNLKILRICMCPRMKELFPPHLLPNLRNLEELDVVSCKNMVEIIGNGRESSVCSTSTPTPVDFALPNLKTLQLHNLPALKSICSGGGKLICNSLQNIIVEICLALKRMPISLPFVELNGQLSPPSSLKEIAIWPREWWDSVDWGHPNEKGALLPLVQLSPQDV